MSRYTIRYVGIAMVTVLLGGCATGGGGDQMSNTVYATHRIVKNLEQNLGDSVTNLNETAAGLQSRVDQTEEQSRRLQAIVEENRMKLDRIQLDLTRLSDALYKHLGLSTVSSAVPDANATMYVPQEGVIVEQPVATEQDSGIATSPPRQTVIATPNSPATTPVNSGNAMEDYKQAQQMYLDKKYSEALNAFVQYIGQYPSNSYSDNAQFWKAQCLLKLERYREAIIEYDQTITKYPESDIVAPSHYYKGLSYLRLGQTQKGAEALRHVVGAFPGSAAATQAQTVLDEMNT